MNEVKTPKKPLLYYYIVVLLAVMLFNFLALPWIVEHHMQILMENRKKLDTLADFLYTKETITGEEFMQILNAPSEPGQPHEEIRC